MSSNASPTERRDVYFSGRVQGVGFRYRARDTAAAFPVTGFVKNLLDGRVHLVVEGQAEDVDRFLAELSDRMARNIEAAQQSQGAATGEFKDFNIRF